MMFDESECERIVIHELPAVEVIPMPPLAAPDYIAYPPGCFEDLFARYGLPAHLVK